MKVLSIIFYLGRDMHDDHLEDCDCMDEEYEWQVWDEFVFLTYAAFHCAGEKHSSTMKMKMRICKYCYQILHIFLIK
jgi:hypothetical protein